MEISAWWGWQACPAGWGCSGAARVIQGRPLPMLPPSLPPGLTSSNLEVDLLTVCLASSVLNVAIVLAYIYISINGNYSSFTDLCVSWLYRKIQLGNSSNFGNFYMWLSAKDHKRSCRRVSGWGWISSSMHLESIVLNTWIFAWWFGSVLDQEMGTPSLDILLRHKTL